MIGHGDTKVTIVHVIRGVIDGFKYTWYYNEEWKNDNQELDIILSLIHIRLRLRGCEGNPMLHKIL